MTKPPAPTPREPDSSWEHYGLYGRVKEALLSAPDYFKTDIRLTGIPATDIVSFNTALGSTIEQRVVATLNRMRPVWDPDDEYGLCRFERQSQTFPDVLFGKRDEQPLMGIELKGWYLLAKEGEPSYRFLSTPQVCADADLLVVYPWCLSEVVSGEPVLLDPFIRPARYMAETRNWYWEYGRKAKSDSKRGVILSSVATPYPTKSDAISDKAESDSGGNFGRIARYRVMDDFIKSSNEILLSGIPADMWRRFLKIFTEKQDAAKIEQAIESLHKSYVVSHDVSEHQTEDLVRRLQAIAEHLV